MPLLQAPLDWRGNTKNGQGLKGTPRATGGGGFDPNYLWYDDFESAPGPLAGSMPQVGAAAWQTYSDPAHPGQAALLTRSGGQMKQSSAGDGSPAYGMGSFGQTPFEFYCEFTHGAGGSQPPVMGCFPDATPANEDFSDMKLLHMYLGTSGFGPQLGHFGYFGDLAANHPMAWRGIDQSYSLVGGARYAFGAKIKSNWLMMQITDLATSTILAKAQSYDPLISQVIGPFGFWETFNATMGYDLAWVKKDTGIIVPTLGQFIETDLSSDPGTAIIDSPYAGGTHQYVGAGDYKVTCTSQIGSGICIREGAIVSGKKTHVCIDVTSITGSWILAVTPPPERPGGLLSNQQPITAPGRYSVDLTHSGADAGAVTVLGSSGAGSGEIHFKYLLGVNDGPGLI